MRIKLNYCAIILQKEQISKKIFKKKSRNTNILRRRKKETNCVQKNWKIQSRKYWLKY